MPGFELFGDKERKSVNEVLETGILMRYGFDGLRENIWKAKEFESSFAERLEVKHCQMVSSGTAALTVALASAGVGAGDEVILPVFTFVASFEAVLALGAVPVLVGIDDTLTLNPAEVANAITPKTKVVMPVHMCGSMAQLHDLQLVCTKHNVLLIEDACQALGAIYNGKQVGSIGDLGCFSFDFVKTITSGEGGAVITNSDVFAVNADHYQDHGHDHIGMDRGAEEHPFLGYNYRISELHAAVGVAQLQRLDEFLAIQETHYSVIREALESISQITFRRVPEGGIENYSFLTFFLPTANDTEQVAALLKENEIDGCFYWFTNNWHYVKQWGHLINQQSLGKLASEVISQMPDYTKISFESSDAIMSRTISVLIKLTWSTDEVALRATKMAQIISKYFTDK